MAHEKVIWGIPHSGDRIGDLHVHSKWEKGLVKTDGKTPPWLRVEQALDKVHDFLALLDHDNIGPSIEAHEYAYVHGYNKDIEVLLGCAEISCVEESERGRRRDGHILAYGITDNIPFNLPASEVVRAIHRMRGYAVAAHPLCRYAHGVGEKTFLEIATSEDPEINWDGTEGYNGIVRDWKLPLWLYEFKNPNSKMIKLYDRKKDDSQYRFGILTGGSDDHNGDVGRVLTLIPEGMTVFDAFRERARTAIVFTGGRGDYSWASIKVQKEAGKLLVAARSLTGSLQVLLN